MTDAEKTEKIEKIKELIEEVNELSKEFSEEELKQVVGGLYEYSSPIFY
jgi:hypothetical protein